MHGRFDGELIPHDFVIVAEKDEQAETLWGAEIGRQDSLEPGGTESVTFTPETPGSYFYVCSVAGHATSHGMWGRVVVK